LKRKTSVCTVAKQVQVFFFVYWKHSDLWGISSISLLIFNFMFMLKRRMKSNLDITRYMDLKEKLDL
jgi:hypothetical protein